MSRYALIILFGLMVGMGMACAVIFASHHDLSWTILSIIGVGINLKNLSDAVGE